MAYNFTCIECKSCKYHQQEMTALRSIKHASNVISCAYRASAFCGAMIVSAAIKGSNVSLSSNDIRKNLV
uniref:Uncharacterized protein n=1 Tax=Rhizophora mucronata TaxID=61149 RepID=A0A2P2MG20_RHIMU